MTKMAIWWPKLSFPPINLWNMPKLNIPFEQMITETDIKDMQELKIEQPTGIDSVLVERGTRYGTFLSHATLAQNLKNNLWAHTGWAWLAPDQRQALEVIMDKVARAVNGDPDYLDNWVDIQGYAKLVEDRLITEQQLQDSAALQSDQTYFHEKQKGSAG